MADPPALKQPAATEKPASGDETSPSAKLTIKVGEKEIHLEARPEIVRQELDRLVDRLSQPSLAEPAGDDRAGDEQVVLSVTAPRTAAGAPPPAAAPAETEESGSPAAALDFIARERGRQLVQPGAGKLLRHVTLDPERLAALYAVDPRGRVLLKKLPSTFHQVRDTVLLLLYGTLTQLGETSENGYHLVRTVRSLGLPIERVPRSFSPDGVLAASSGRHRAKRYRLTGLGIGTARS